jgi:RNA polymerase sigma-70 factor (ECF subfamily)
MDAGANLDLTMLIQASSAGDRKAQDRLFAVVYDELHRIASRSRFVGGAGETLQATALVNEAYIALSQRLALARTTSSSTRDAFYTAVGRAMRTILRDHWRSRNAEKRGGGARAAALPDTEVVAAPSSDFDAIDFLALDQALDRLEQFNPRWFQVVTHRYFAGREIDETAELLGISKSTVKSDWQLARAWLHREIERGSK